MPAKVYTVKATVFPVVMHGCESWTIKKVEHQNMDAFTTVVLEKTIESLLMKVKEESEKLNIHKTKIMASSPITSWQMSGKRVETVEIVTDFIFLRLQNQCRW